MPDVPQPTLPAGHVVADRFVIERLAGQGGMGAVYLARDRERDAPVALKVLGDVGDARRFHREIEILSELDHPAIVGFVAHGLAGGAPYLAMEWLEGEDLAATLERGPLAIDASVDVVARAAEAVGHAHARGVVHRDIKPSNVFLPHGSFADAKLLDFGIARPGQAVGFTKSGMVVGTPAYMAPEQASGAADVDARADVFALGCVLFETLTGRAAFAGAHVMAILAKVLFEDPPRVRELRSGVPRAVADLVAAMLSKNPGDRPRDGNDVAARLAEARAARNASADAATAAFDASSVRALGPPSGALGRGEQRYVTVLLASRHGAPEQAATAVAGEAANTALELRARFGPHVARVEPMVDGLVVCVVAGLPSATDQAACAARMALALHHARPGAPSALATGRALLAGQVPVGEAIDRAAAMVRDRTPLGAAEPRGRGVMLDETTAGLLGPDLIVEGGARGLVLTGERDAGDGVRTLLGRPTSCVGRDKELAFLEGSFAECAGEPIARVVLVTAAPGTGKSRLRREVLGRIGARAQIWLGRGDALSEGSPRGLVARLLRRVFGLLDGEPPDVHARKIRARVARGFAEPEAAAIAAFLGELAGAPGDDPALVAARGDPQLLGARMHAAWLDFVGRECGEGPLVLALDDMHWADRASVDYVDAALRALAERPLWVIALARPEVTERFPGLWAEREPHELRLAGLTPRAGERLVREVLGDAVTADEAAALVRQTAGNAFFLEELIRARAEGKAEGAPETVVAMVQARLDAVDADARRLLRAASVLGEVFWRGGVAALLGEPVTQIDDRLEALVAGELLVERGAGRFVGERELAFRHALVREAAYATLTDEDRALGHRLAAGWLEAAGEREPMLLAGHFERGGERARAAECYLRAAEQALEAHDLAGSIARAELGLACAAAREGGPAAGLVGALRLVQASAHDWRGENQEAVLRGHEAMAALARGGPAWHRAACSVVVSARRMGDRAGVSRVAREIVALDDASLSGGIALRCLGRVVIQVLVSGVQDLARELLARLTRVIGAGEDAIADPLARVWVWSGRSMTALFAGDPTPFLDGGARMIALARASGDERTACNVAHYVGIATNVVGAFEDTCALYVEWIAASERHGLSTFATMMRIELAFARVMTGRLDEARALAERALVETRAQGDRFQEARAFETLALALDRACRPDEAEARARDAIAATEIAPPFKRRSLGLLARILLGRGRTSEALEVAREAASYPVTAQILATADVTPLVHAEALRAAGHHDEARVVAAAARDTVLAQADRFRHPRFRDAFLAVDHNARLLELAAAWSVG